MYVRVCVDGCFCYCLDEYVGDCTWVSAWVGECVDGCVGK